LSRQFFGHHIQIHPTAAPSSSSSLSRQEKEIKVFCAIYTYSGNRNQIKSIEETWGRRCDGFLAASNETITGTAIVNIPHDGPWNGQYHNIWQKVRSILGYLYDNFLQDYDFYFLCGDDTYVIMENLKAFLTSPEFVRNAGGSEYPHPVYAGAWMHPFWETKNGYYAVDFYYLAGGAGYVLGRNTLRSLVENVLPNCHNTTWDSAEDLYMADCLLNYMNVTGYDTRDDKGRERFIPYDPIASAGVLDSLSAVLQKDFSDFGFFVRAQRYVSYWY
jgi:hypothetical protein